MKKTKEQRIEKEIKRLEREQQKRSGPGYLIYFIMIITVIYIADEISTQIGTQMQSVIASQIFAPIVGNDVAVARMSALGFVPQIFSVLAILYKPLSDRYGRRVFLVINTLGMGIGLLFISLATNIPVYLMGAAFISFFIPNDMQTVYIQESAPQKHRGKIYFAIKSAATLGMFLIPLLRKIYIPSTDLSKWRFVYLVPAIVAFAASVVAFFCIKESDVFIENRLRYLRLSPEEKETEKAKKDDRSAQGGIVSGLKFTFGHKQLRWLVIAGGLVMFGMLITQYYETIMTYGYAQQFVAVGMDIEAAKLEATAFVTRALMLFSLGSALFQAIPSLIVDRLGRKPTAIVMSCIMLLSFLIFYFGSRQALNSYFVGFFCGAAVGSYWSAGDIITLMTAESAPTGVRASVAAVRPIVSGIISAIGMLIVLVLGNILGDAAIGITCLCTVVPGMAAGLALLCLKVKETKDVDMNNVETEMNI